MNILRRAREFAFEKHSGQRDDEEQPFILHPMKVAHLLMQVGADNNVIAAAWLHDTIEDTETTYEQLLEEFGEDVANLVNEVTHEGKKEEGYYFPRLKSKRGIMLKYADRLSNLSRMNTWTEERRQHYLKKSKFWKDGK